MSEKKIVCVQLVNDGAVASDELEYLLYNYKNDIVIAGNDDYEEYCNSKLLGKIFDYKQDWYNVDALKYIDDLNNVLEAVTDKKWNNQTIIGRVQGEWQVVYFTENVPPSVIDELEMYYFNTFETYLVDLVNKDVEVDELYPLLSINEDYAKRINVSIHSNLIKKVEELYCHYPIEVYKPHAVTKYEYEKCED